MMGISLRAFLLVFLHALNPAAATSRDTPALLDAIEKVTGEEDDYIFGERQMDAVLLVGTASFESDMRLHAEGDCHPHVGCLAHGAYQLHMREGYGDADTQTRAALGHLRRDKRVCRWLPMAAFMSGNCGAGIREAQQRMWRIHQALHAHVGARIGLH